MPTLDAGVLFRCAFAPAGGEWLWACPQRQVAWKHRPSRARGAFTVKTRVSERAFSILQRAFSPIQAEHPSQNPLCLRNPPNFIHAHPSPLKIPFRKSRGGGCKKGGGRMNSCHGGPQNMHPHPPPLKNALWPEMGRKLPPVKTTP